MLTQNGLGLVNEDYVEGKRGIWFYKYQMCLSGSVGQPRTIYPRLPKLVFSDHLKTVKTFVAVSKFVAPLNALPVIVPDPSLSPRTFQV